TTFDPWGVVANEACASGVPIITTSVAGASGEIVRDGENGAILPLDVDAWAQAACRLLEDPAWHASRAQAGLRLVQGHTFAAAAEGIRQAVVYGLKARRA
ncbi:MAG: hypothetical protein RI907_3641, partial [Pseudomonadota bacterium]